MESRKRLKVLVAQSCPTLCNSMDCSPLGSSVHGILQARILQCIASHSLLQGISLTQGLNLSLLHCRQILCHLSHQGSSQRERCPPAPHPPPQSLEIEHISALMGLIWYRDKKTDDPRKEEGVEGVGSYP